MFAVGWNGTILHYDGSVWSAMSSGTINTLYGVWGSSGSDVFAVGEYDTILHYGGTVSTTTVPATTTVPVTSTTTTAITDSDGDGIPDSADNCPSTSNGPVLGTCLPGSDKAGATCHSDADCVIGCSTNGHCSKIQEDTDADGSGDVCDNCPLNCNSKQLDANGNGIGDVCDTTPECGGCGQPQCEQQC